MSNKKFNLNIDNDFFEKEDFYKYCASCGTQMDKNAKFCIECGSKEFFDSLKEYRSEKSLYCIKCLSKLPDGKKVCACCGERKYATAKMAFYHHYNEEFCYKILDENKEMEAELAEFDSENQHYKDEITQLEKEISNLKRKIKPYNDELIDLEEGNEIKELSDILDKINDVDSNELSIDQLRKKSRELNKKIEILNNKLSSFDEDSLRIIEYLDSHSNEMEYLKKEIDLVDFKIELSRKVRGKKAINYDIYDQEFINIVNTISGYYSNKSTAYSKMAELAKVGDYRAILVMEQKNINGKELDDYSYIKNNLEAFALLDINGSDKKKNAPLANDLALAYLYYGKLCSNITRYIPNADEKAAVLYRKVSDSGYKEYHFDSDFQYLLGKIKKKK